MSVFCEVAFWSLFLFFFFFFFFEFVVSGARRGVVGLIEGGATTF